MRYTWKKYKLTLNNPFTLSYGTFDHRWSYIVRFDEGECHGYGEATAISYYGWSEEKIEQQLTDLVDILQTGMSMEEILSRDDVIPPVRNCLQCAYVDLRARQKGVSISEYYGIQMKNDRPKSSITISGNTPEVLKDQIDHFDWEAYKIKMGSQNEQMKFEVIRNYPDKKFRIDANGGWTIDSIEPFADFLKMANIELIEQPFSKENESSILELKEIVDIPLFADESCVNIEDIERCTAFYDGVNIKLMKCGGWDRSLEMIEKARESNLKIMLGCMTESSIGISHAAQLLDVIDVADVDGSELLSNNPAGGVILEKGVLVNNGSIGSGAELNVPMETN